MRAIKLFKTAVFSLAVSLLAFGSAAYAAAGKGREEKAAAEKKVEKDDTYPLDVCPVSGEKLGSMGDPSVRFYDGREVRFCCAGCPEVFEEDLEGNLKKLDQMIVAKQKPEYPLEVCVVSGEKLGEMGEPVDYVHNNQLVRFCCAGCLDMFKEDPDQYLKKLRAAYEAKKKGKETAAPEEGGTHQGRGAHEEHGGHSDH